MYIYTNTHFDKFIGMIMLLSYCHYMTMIMMTTIIYLRRRGRKPATVKDINMVMGGECEIPGELPTSFPITPSPAMPILHMNSHSNMGCPFVSGQQTSSP